MLIDSGATVSAIPLKEYTRLKRVAPEAITELPGEQDRYRVSAADAHNITPLRAIKLRFTMGDRPYEEMFLVLKTMNGPLLGYCFLWDNDLDLLTRSKCLATKDLTFQLNAVITEEGKKKRVKTPKGIPVTCAKTLTIPPGKYEVLKCKVTHPENDYNGTTGIVAGFKPFLSTTRAIAITNTLSHIGANGETDIGVVNVSDFPVTIKDGTRVASLELLTPDQAAYLQPVEPAVAERINQLRHIKVSKEEFNKLTFKHEPDEQSKHWFPTPENCKDPSRLTGTMKRIYDEIVKFKKEESLDPNHSAAMKAEFLSKFSWKGSILTKEEREEVEKVILEYHDIFARHRLHIGSNDEIKVKLTPEHDKPVFKRSPPCPIHYKEDLMVELALMQYYGIITTLATSKYSSPIFCQRKSDGRLRILTDLRRINHLIRNDYDENNFPLACMADAMGHIVGKTLFSLFDASQAYFSIHLADALSVELLSFNFASRTFAFRRLAQGLNRSVSAFSSIMMHYLQGNIARDECHAFVDDVFVGTKGFKKHIVALRNLFASIRKSGVKLTMHKCEFGKEKVKYLGSTITTQGIQPNEKKIQDFLKTVKVPTTLHQLQRLLGFLQWFRSYIPEMGEKVFEFYKLLMGTKNTKLKTTAIHAIQLEVLKKDLVRACNMTLRLPMAGKQFVLITDASVNAAGFVLMIEDYTIPGNDKQVKRRYAPVSFGSKVFQGAQRKMSIYAKEFLALHYALDTFAHILWGTSKKPIIVLTDNAGLSCFFKSKTIPPSLWNYMDHVLSFRWEIGHIPGKANAAADFLSRLNDDPMTPLDLTIQDRIPAHDIIIDLKSASDTDIQKEKKQLEKWEKEAARKGDKESTPAYGGPTDPDAADLEVAFTMNVMYAEPVLTPEQEMLNVLADENPCDKFDLSTKSKALNMIAEQRQDRELREVRSWLQGVAPTDLKYAPSRVQKYHRQLARLVIRDNLVKRKYFDDTGRISHYQLCLPSQLINELLLRLHNDKMHSHRGVRQTIVECRKLYYFPNYQEIIEDYVRNCSSCLQTKRIPESQIRPPLQSISAQTNFPGDMLELDLVGKLKPSSSYIHILTALDVFSQYMFAVPLRSVSAESIAQALVKIFLQHSYIPKVILTDKGSVFRSALVAELAKLLNIELKHASVKHAQTIGALERRHSSLKKVLKIYENPQQNNWHKFVDYAIYSHNTMYNHKTRCTPAEIFHGHTPTQPLELRFEAKAVRQLEQKFHFTHELQDRLLKLYEAQKEDLLDRYVKNKEFYNKRAHAKPLKIASYCLLLNPLYDSQKQMLHKMQPKWLPNYRVEIRLANENYIIRKVGTNYTQQVHRLRLRPYVPQYPIKDIDAINKNNFKSDPTMQEHLKEPGLLDRMRELLAQEPAGTTNAVPEGTAAKSKKKTSTAIEYTNGAPGAPMARTAPTKRMAPSAPTTSGAPTASVAPPAPTTSRAPTAPTRPVAPTATKTGSTEAWPLLRAFAPSPGHWSTNCARGRRTVAQ